MKFNDGCPESTKEYFDNKIFEVVCDSLKKEHADFADFLIQLKDEAKNGGVKIVHVTNWPEHLFIYLPDGIEIDLMTLINGLIFNMGCEIVIE